MCRGGSLGISEAYLVGRIASRKLDFGRLPATQVFAGKLHFGYIYGISMIGAHRAFRRSLVGGRKSIDSST